MKKFEGDKQVWSSDESKLIRMEVGAADQWTGENWSWSYDWEELRLELELGTVRVRLKIGPSWEDLELGLELGMRELGLELNFELSFGIRKSWAMVRVSSTCQYY